jgi:hypothetical protein
MDRIDLPFGRMRYVRNISLWLLEIVEESSCAGFYWPLFLSLGIGRTCGLDMWMTWLSSDPRLESLYEHGTF